MEKSSVRLIIVVGLIVGFMAVLFFTATPNFKSSAKIIENFNGEVKEFNVIAKQFSFDPAVIEVNKGDKVILNIESVDVAHGITIREFGVSQYLEAGKSITIEFIADKSGEFAFFCNIYCGRGHSDMKGRLIVN